MEKLIKLILSVMSLMLASTSFAAGEVRLQKAFSIVSYTQGLSGQMLRFEANVADLAGVKQVYVHLRDGGGLWKDVPLKYNRAAENGREIWSGQLLTEGEPFDATFALKYVVNGRSYWDNNSGRNFTVAKDTGTVLGHGLNVYDTLYAASATFYRDEPDLYGKVTLRNLAPVKTVRVHYTNDDWASKSIAVANWSPKPYEGWSSQAVSPNRYGFEDWSYTLHVGSSDHVEYAIEYIVNGRTYWDNNYGRNYRTTIIRR